MHDDETKVSITHASDHLTVSEVSAKAVETQVRWTEHCILVGDLPLKSVDRWEGSAPVEHDWIPSTLAFLPRNSNLCSFASDTYRGSGIFLSHEMLAETAADHVNLDTADLEFKQVFNPAMVSLAGSIRAFAHTGELAAWPLLTESLSISLSAAALKSFSDTANTALSQLRNGLDADRQARVVDFIHANVSKPLTIADLASVAALSPYHFARSFRKAMGVTPLRYVATMRAERAKIMLKTTQLPLVDIAFQCGYSSQQHMNAAFKAITGITPGEHRRHAVS